MTRLGGSRRTSTVLSSDDELATKGEKHSTGKLKSAKNTVTSTKKGASKPPTDGSPPKNGSKGKGTRQAESQSATKPIYSFFNAATLRQHSLQPLSNLEKSSVLQSGPEVINDTSEGQTSHDAAASLSQVSSTVLAMRKRRFSKFPQGDDLASLPPSASQKFRKVGNGDRVASVSIRHDDNRPWTEKFAPKDLSELAVHKRKVADVRQWIETTLHGTRRKVLVLKGIAGTGKTTTVKLLAQELGISLVDWSDSAVADISGPGIENRVTSSSRFEDFVGRVGRSAGLLLYSDIPSSTKASVTSQSHRSHSEEETRSQILLVEDFPNTSSRSSSALQSFRSTIMQYIAMPVAPGSKLTPIIMVISETLLSTNIAAADSFTAHRLLGPELSTNPSIHIIEFNPVAPTILVKALELIVIKEARISGRRKTPGAQVLKHLAEAGDIRSAVSSLEFMCLLGDQGDTWSSKVAFTKTKHPKVSAPLTKPEEDVLKLITNRESSLGIFHSVGKVVYNKRIQPAINRAPPQPPSWLPQYKRDQEPETDANHLIDELGTDTATFVAALHENYALSCGRSSPENTLDSMLGCIDILSDSDLLSLDRFAFGTRAFAGSATDTLRQDEMCFQVAVRGLLFNLPCPVNRAAAAGSKRGDAHRMLYPASLRLWKRREEIDEKLEGLIAHVGRYGIKDANLINFESRRVGASLGVDSWKRNGSSDLPDETTEGGVHYGARVSAELKMEMLTDRLPYMAQILDGKQFRDTGHLLLDKVKSVSGVSRPMALVGEDEYDENADNQDLSGLVEQWATDQPDPETSKPHTARRHIQSIAEESKSVFDLPAMATRVESEVGKLILEDDDIVDD